MRVPQAIAPQEYTRVERWTELRIAAQPRVHGMTIDAIADEVLTTLGSGRQIAPFTARPSGLTLEQSYRTLALLDRKRTARGETRRGRKIGFTNRTIWAQYK